MNESELQSVCLFHIHPRDTIIYSDKRFINIDIGSMGGSHWTCFRKKDYKSVYFDSFGGEPDKFLLNFYLNH